MNRDALSEALLFILTILGLSAISSITGVRPRDLMLSYIVFLLTRLNYRLLKPKN